MTTTPDVAALQAALDAGPTPGEWRQSHRECDDDMYRTQVYCSKGEEIATLAWYPVSKGDGITGTSRAANASYIAACSPDRITRVLAALRAAEQRAEAAEGLLREARDRMLIDRTALVECHTGPDGVDEEGAEGVAEYDELLSAIDAALKQGEHPCQPL